MLNGGNGDCGVGGRTGWPKWAGYPIAVILEGALTAGLLVLHPYIPLGEYPINYVIAIMAVAYWFGEGPAVLAFLLGLITFDYYFIPPLGSVWPPTSSPAGWATYVSFFIGSGLVAFAMLLIRRSQQRNIRLAEELRKSNEHTTSILESITDAFFAVDREWRFIYVNAQAERFLNKTRDELVGKNMWDAFPEFIGSRFYNEYQRAVAEQVTVEFDEYVPSLEAWLSVRAYPSAAGLSVYFSDITERIWAEEALRHHLSLLQQALAPPKPVTSSGYRVGSVYLPAFPGEQIGGDFYDVFKTESGGIGIVIGDVAGKGVEAAALAAAARSTVRSFAYELSSPGDALFHANTVLESQELGSGRFATVFLVAIDPPTGRLSYARAGHPSAAIRRAGGRVEFLEQGGLPIGLLAGQVYGTFEDRLDPGDKIILYTDGIMEARRDVELFGLAGIIRALVNHGSGTSEEMAAGLLEDAREWADGWLRDDVAILVVERLAGESDL
jgi:PAS domain S-box-containing protein